MSENKKNEPRQMTDIQREYQELCLKSGQAHYQILILNKEVDSINGRILEVNQEAAARMELDKKSESKEEVKTDE